MYEKNMERNRLTNYFCFLTLVWRGFAWLGLLNWLAAAFQRKRERDTFSGYIIIWIRGFSMVAIKRSTRNIIIVCRRNRTQR